MLSHLSFFRGLLVVLGLGILPHAISAKTYVIPHVLDTSGDIRRDSFSFDTQLTLVSLPADNGSNTPVTVELYLYDNTGAPMTGSIGDVCNPCMLEMSAADRQTNITIGDLIVSHGGGFNAATKTGYAVLKTDDATSSRLKLEARILNSLVTTSNLSGFNFQPTEIQENNPTPGKRAFVIPHILEKQGTINTTQFTFDTTLFMTYTPSFAGGSGATAELYLYDDQGQVLQGQTAPVCNPCLYELGSGAAKKLSVRIDDLMTAAGAFNDTNIKLGFGILVVGGGDPDGVAAQAFVVNSHTSPFDLSVFGFDPVPIQAASAVRTFVLPHVLESSGRTSSNSFCFDSTIFVTYTPGLAKTAPGGGATLDLYLYDASGQPMRSATSSSVCNPCSFDLSSAAPRKVIVVDDLITAAGGFDSSVKTGFGVIRMSGADPTNVVLQTEIVNSHTGPFDLSVFTYQPEPLQSALTRDPSTPTKRTFVIPHLLEKSGRINANSNAWDTSFLMTFASDPFDPRIGTTYVDLYLFDPNGLPMRGAAKEVCYPCSFELNGPNQKVTMPLEDKVMAAGGFSSNTKLGYGIVVVSGDSPDSVNLQGFVVNAHSSPFDLSVFGFEPQPLEAATLIAPVVAVNTVSNTVVLTWSTNSPGYTVEQIDRLGAETGSLNSLIPTIVGREYQVTNTSLSSSNAFFRLRR